LIEMGWQAWHKFQALLQARLFDPIPGSVVGLLGDVCLLYPVLG
jgi:hypothetical protein